MGLSFEGFLIKYTVCNSSVKYSCKNTEIWIMPQLCTFVSQNYITT